MSDKKKTKEENIYLMNSLRVNKDELKALKKKLSKISPRPEKGVETLFRLVSKNQYTLNSMVDKKSSIMISINALILSIILGTVLNQLDKDPHLIYPAIMILVTNLASITFSVLATRPELTHGGGEVKNLMFYGNFHQMSEKEYVDDMLELMDQGDELYRIIAKDTFYLGKKMNSKFKLLRVSFNIFLIGIILSVTAFLLCHILFG